MQEASLEDKKTFELYLKCTLLGICPPANSAAELRQMLATLSPEEREICKRKWRKLKRKAMKNVIKYDEPAKVKTKSTKSLERRMTYNYITRKVKLPKSNQ